jgi:hypothetical protein
VDEIPKKCSINHERQLKFAARQFAIDQLADKPTSSVQTEG